MINTPIEHIFDVMRKDKLTLYQVRFNGKMQACNEDKSVDIETSINQLQQFIENLDGSGVVEIILPTKEPGEISRKGGDVRPKYVFTVKIGGSELKGNSSPLQGIASNEMKDLRAENERLKEKVKELELKIELKKIEEKYEDRIAGLEDNKDQFAAIIKPYIPQILGSLFPQAPVAHALSENVSAVTDVDAALDYLEKVYGADLVDRVICDLAEAAKRNPEMVRSFFPQIKLIA